MSIVKTTGTKLPQLPFTVFTFATPRKGAPPSFFPYLLGLSQNPIMMMDDPQLSEIGKIKSKATGISILDEQLDGGLPEGSLVCVYANPMSNPEAFLYQFASVRKTYYFNTSRPAQYIQQNITAMGFSLENIEFIDVFTQYYLNEFG
jgi:hypothetical protein